jgi:hypothetical protein
MLRVAQVAVYTTHKYSVGKTYKLLNVKLVGASRNQKVNIICLCTQTCKMVCFHQSL